MCTFWLHIAAGDEFVITVVNQKFMTVGHSYLPSDRDFGSIETERCKHNTIFVPEEWPALILKSRRKNPFIVTNMAQADFMALILVSKSFVNRRKWIWVCKDKSLQFQ